MFKAVIYYRVSTKGQGESGLGLEAQENIVRHYLKDSQVLESYTEVISAKIPPGQRPGLKKAIEHTKNAGAFLVVAKVDRLSRVTEDALAVWNDLDARLFACDIPQKLGSSMDKFTLTIYMAIADRERELISIRTKGALAALKARGKKLGNPRTFSSGELEKAAKANRAKASANENNQRATALAKALRSQGASLKQIADALNAQGFKTSQEKKFSKTQVSRLLSK